MSTKAKSTTRQSVFFDKMSLWQSVPHGKVSLMLDMTKWPSRQSVHFAVYGKVTSTAKCPLGLIWQTVYKPKCPPCQSVPHGKVSFTLYMTKCPLWQSVSKAKSSRQSVPWQSNPRQNVWQPLLIILPKQTWENLWEKIIFKISNNRHVPTCLVEAFKRKVAVSIATHKNCISFFNI